MIKVKRILVLAPHPDDGEFGCGGTIARYIEDGAEIRIQAFSLCEESLPKGLKSSHMEGEMLAACLQLGIEKINIKISNYPVRRFNEHRQDILEELVSIRNDFAPEMVFLPASDDIHQDHQVISQEGIRAFKHISVLGYELPWNTVAFKAQALFGLKERHLDKKIRALKNYQSQSERPYFKDSFVRSLARVRGTQAVKDYAEAFEVLRLTQ